MLLLFKKLLSEHPTLIFTLSYLLITVIGVLYSYFFYAQFGLNIIKFADLSDFLLASILEPRSLVGFILLVLSMVVILSIDFTLRRKITVYGDFIRNVFKSKYTDPIGVVVILLVFTPFPLKHLAVKNATEIKAGDYDSFEVRLSDPGSHPATQQLGVLGSSSRYGYFYDPQTQAALVVPLENISYMRKTPAATN